MPLVNMLDMASRTMDGKKKNWIKKAVPKEHRGVFKEKAERAGMSTREFARKHESDSGTLGKEARLADNLMGMGKRKKSKMYSHSSSQRMD